MRTVTGFFTSRDQAEKAVADLRRLGWTNEISIIAKDEQGGEKGPRTSNFTGGDGISDGVTSGAAIGGLAGLALGAGALAIPGFGPLIAAGPIAAAISGAATGGVAGGLVDYGIPEEKGREYEGRLRKGKMMVSIKADDMKAQEAASSLRQHGAENVEIH